MTDRLSAFLALAGALLFSSCSSEKPAPDSPVKASSSAKPVVYATNYPLFYFAQRIGGEKIDLRFPAGDEVVDPSLWKPSDEAIVAMQQAGKVLINGATFEKWLETASLPEATLVNTSVAFSGEFLSSGKVVTHSHGPGGEHSHGGTAFTTWMDFQQAIWQAEEVRNALQALDPASETFYSANFEKLADDLDALHQEFKTIGEKLRGVPLIASHPVYQYFARRYGLSLESVHWEPDTVPDEAAQGELKKILEKHPAKWMIWESEPVPESVALLRDLGIGSVVVAPCGNRPTKGDWLLAMRANAANLKSVIP